MATTKQKVTLSLDRATYSKFLAYKKANGISISSWVSVQMEQALHKEEERHQNNMQKIHNLFKT
ncbi:MAG: hypothetical protein PF440_04805 [Thiomicrorhabdus sp.]|nr:hypothetical protein [Thiomicrorhabdus sp.]